MMNRDEMICRLEGVRMELDDLLGQKRLIDALVDDAARQFEELRIEITVAELMSDGVAEFAEARKFSDIFNSANSVTLPTRETLGESMTTSTLLARALDREDMGVRRAFANLDEGGKARIEASYRRHAFNCNKYDMKPDPSWLREAIHDAVHVPPGEREESKVQGLMSKVVGAAA